MPAHEETEWKKRSSPCYSSVPCSPPRWRKSASTAVAANTRTTPRRPRSGAESGGKGATSRSCKAAGPHRALRPPLVQRPPLPRPAPPPPPPSRATPPCRPPPNPHTTPPPTGSRDQKARDADRRAILEAELRKAEARHAELRKEYSDGNPERNAIDLRNPQRRQERSDELKASVARSESDIAGIKREIARLPAAAD